MPTSLEWNARAVGWLRDAVNNCNLNHVPQSIKKIIKSGAWRKRYEMMHVFEFEQFSDFITKPPAEGGCGWKPKLVEGLLQKAGDVEALTMWREAIKVGQGHRTDLDDNINEVQPSKGTSRAYTLDRLKREHRDLFDKVCVGELSANAAAIEAGFRKKLTPLEQIVKLLPKLTEDEREKLVLMLEDWP